MFGWGRSFAFWASAIGIFGGVSAWAGPRALVVIPHPDDETMMAGTIARLFERGYEVAVVYVTRGEGGGLWTVDPTVDPALGQLARLEKTSVSPQEIAAIRADELREALRVLGITDSTQLGFPDRRDDETTIEGLLASGIWDRARLRREIQDIARRWQPNLVLTLRDDVVETHLHHRALAQVLRELGREGGLGARLEGVFGVSESAWYDFTLFNQMGPGVEETRFDLAKLLAYGRAVFADSEDFVRRSPEAVLDKHMEWMGGKIGVDSIPGSGSTFRFTLPARAAPIA